jgi:hypothetical protein
MPLKRKPLGALLPASMKGNMIRLPLVFAAVLITGCAVTQEPLVPPQAQAIGCSRAASDSALATLRPGYDSTSAAVQLIKAGHQRFPNRRISNGSLTLEYIVLPEGRVDRCSIRVLEYTHAELIAPGVDMLLDSEFSRPTRPTYVRQWLRWEVQG